MTDLRQEGNVCLPFDSKLRVHKLRDVATWLLERSEGRGQRLLPLRLGPQRKATGVGHLQLVSNVAGEPLGIVPRRGGVSLKRVGTHHLYMSPGDYQGGCQ